MIKLRSPIEFTAVLSSPEKWRFSTAIATIGTVGTLINFIYLLSVGNMPPRAVWNGFAAVGLLGASIELVQAVRPRKTNNQP